MISARAVTNEYGMAWSHRDYLTDVVSGESHKSEPYEWHPTRIKGKKYLCLGDITDKDRWSNLALFILRQNDHYNYLTPCDIYCSGTAAKRMDVGNYSYIEHHKTIHRNRRKHVTLGE